MKNEEQREYWRTTKYKTTIIIQGNAIIIQGNEEK
jgi:hypothetical protein